VQSQAGGATAQRTGRGGPDDHASSHQHHPVQTVSVNYQPDHLPDFIEPPGAT